VNGAEVIEAVGRAGGPWLGELLERLLDSVIGDPRRNTRHQLLVDARAWASKSRSG